LRKHGLVAKEESRENREGLYSIVSPEAVKLNIGWYWITPEGYFIASADQDQKYVCVAPGCKCYLIKLAKETW